LHSYLRPINALLTVLASMLCWCLEAAAQDYDLSIPRVAGKELQLASSMVSPIHLSDENLEQGRMLFRSRCTWCHGDNGQGNGPGSENLAPRPRDFTDANFHALRSDGELFWVIKNGSTVTKRMPAWSTIIKDSDIWALVYYLRTLAPRQAANTPVDGLTPFGNEPPGREPAIAPRPRPASSSLHDLPRSAHPVH